MSVVLANPAAAIFACNSMHLPWWVGPAAFYLLIGWGLSAVFALINLARITYCERPPDFKAVNVSVWALYALPILTVALMYCRVITKIPPMPGWLGYALIAYSFLVPLITLCHSVILARSISAAVFAGRQRPTSEG